MRAFRVEEIKPFMSGLLSGHLFDEWQFRGAELGLECKITLQQGVERAFIGETDRDFLIWPEIQPKIYMLIKGDKTPAYIRIALSLAPDLVPDGNRDWIEAYTVNIQYEKGVLSVTTGISDKTFSADKEPMRIWDLYIPEYFRKYNITLTEN